MTQLLLPIINDGGRILNVSSGLARFSSPGYGVYASLKTAIETYTRYQALELGSRKITVNVIAPGAIETDFGGKNKAISLILLKSCCFFSLCQVATFETMRT